MQCKHALTRMILLLVASWASVIAAQEHAPEDATDLRPTVTVGLIDTFTPAFYIYTYTPLIEALKAVLPHYRFVTRELPASAATNPALLNANDFLILSSGNMLMVPEAGLEQIATLRRSHNSQVSETLGSVFVVKSDSALKTLADLKGKSAAATVPWSFEGWQIAMGEIQRSGYDYEHFFSEVTFTEWNFPDVVSLVAAGQVAVGVLSTCELEQAVHSGTLAAGELRVVGRQLPDSPDGCMRSTALYPDLVFASTERAQPNLVREVTVALLTLPPNSLGYDWVSNNRMKAVQELLKNLRIGPWQYLRDNSLMALAERWKTEISLAIAALLALLVHIARVNRLLTRRTLQLKREETARQQAAEALQESRERLDLVERAGMVSQLSSMFAHEIKQPLTIISNFISGLRMMLESDRVDKEKMRYVLQRVEREAHRAADIVERVRAVGRKERADREIVPVSELIQQSVQHAGSSAAHPGVTVRAISPEWRVQGNMLELELVIVNFLKNAARAQETMENATPLEVFAVPSDDGDIAIAVADHAPPVSQEVFEALGRITRSASKDGMGFGLSIAASIAEAHGGHLKFERNQPSGIIAKLVLPLAMPQENNKEPTC